MKSRTVVALALTLGLVAPSAALARPPVREVLPLPLDVTVGECGFAVLIHAEGQTIRTTWYDDAGDPVRAVESYPGLTYVLRMSRPASRSRCRSRDRRSTSSTPMGRRP